VSGEGEGSSRSDDGDDSHHVRAWLVAIRGCEQDGVSRMATRCRHKRMAVAPGGRHGMRIDKIGGLVLCAMVPSLQSSGEEALTRSRQGGVWRIHDAQEVA
jgi:hypothetical protein